MKNRGKRMDDNEGISAVCSRERVLAGVLNMNSGGSAVAKAPPAKEAQNESRGHPSRAKAAACPESGRRHKNAPGLGHWLDTERLLDKETARPPEKEVQAEAPAYRSSPAGAAVSGESDLEALLARLRAFGRDTTVHIWSGARDKHLPADVLSGAVVVAPLVALIQLQLLH
ncbi:hypothetical protein EYF80_029848 [Liparis tanakae]|uniref:Uncharacterized protein n=1 Tax=Liparis tanakae TaxID=230148 RepID=A0A4Z2H541_9TELE|nr:hypothetical protein EYF80_029848 [Liparis tanakae]